MTNDFSANADAKNADTGNTSAANPAVQTFASEEALVEAFTQTLVGQLKAAIAERGRAYLVVSGGRTPVPLFTHLSQQELPWWQVTILLADERWLPATHEASNTRLVREHLLQNKAASAEFMRFNNDAESLDAAVQSFNRTATDLPTFDVVILGLGEDGHTASIFPCAAERNLAMTTSSACLAVHPTTAPFARLSLSKARLLNSRHLYFHLVGASKAQVLEQVTQANADFPASAFLKQSAVPVDVMLALPPALGKE